MPNKTYDESGKEVTMRAKIGCEVTHINKMDAQAWTIFGVLIALLAPPIVYYVFGILDYRFGFKILIWLAFVLFCACLIRISTFISFLQCIGEKAYGKRNVT